MQIDLEKTKDSIEQAHKEFLTPNAPQVLTQLLSLRKEIDKAIEEARTAAKTVLETLQGFK